ncbi:hypothetical protein RF679_18020 [Undibacterium cyanobacteriorum]|uniref:Uncharacterized protein n=1 Tax=Undibacterium cyanobacteriorum TaxID=3073561 RepID=A0ABY9RIL0_9BURK|nr:hypothetical protein [Undibacterium sp. 20NA77.5]WMW80514.1 hypothetical protein RF679_18020 [Undibacterium sp. 20NA77.5]
MAVPDHIKRLQADADGLDFDGLRRRGIELLQQLSSGRWTDYNLHDPGVTLLELLCYGLTDLVYRTDFAVADFLSNETGTIDFHAQALYPPAEIFPNHAVTDLDFCKLLYDQLPEIEDVWAHSHTEAHSTRGLMSVFIKPHASLFRHTQEEQSAAHRQLRHAAVQLLSRYRSLGRDIDDIHIVQPTPFTLAGDIEIDDSRSRAEIYADIIFRCAKLVTSGSQITRFEEALREGKTWDEILSGPLTERGYIDEASFLQESYDIDVIKLITLIRHIPGVLRVNQLSLIDEQGQTHEHLQFDHHDANCPVLHFINTPEMILALRLHYSKNATLEPMVAEDIEQVLSVRTQREIHAFGEQVTLFLRKYEFEHEAFRRNRARLDQLIPLPKGEARQFDEYFSLGEHLPAIYGVNHFGVPQSEPDAVHAKARQLKAYLFPFEQMMANYLSSLQHLRQLYSLDPCLDRSYFTQFLSNQEIPNLEVLYTNKANQAELERIVAGQDNFEERRNRVLDSLLALYGENYPETELRRYDVYFKQYVGRQILLNKIYLLRHLCDLSSGRGTGRCLTNAWHHDATSPIERKVRILLGSFQEQQDPSLISHLQGETKLISDKRYLERLQKQINYPSELHFDKLEVVPLPKSESYKEDFRIPHGTVCDAMLQQGTRWENYRIHRVSEQHAWLCLLTKDEQIWPICFLPIAEISQFLRCLIDALAGQCLQSEGVHVLEHILLRPRAPTGQDNHKRAIDHEFYCHRVSIILPAYTARFQDPKARLWVEKLIAEELPAHLLPEFYWLDFAFLAQFENRYQKWLTQLALHVDLDYQGDCSELDRSAEDVIEFLKKNRHQQINRYWI